MKITQFHFLEGLGTTDQVHNRLGGREEKKMQRNKETEKGGKDRLTSVSSPLTQSSASVTEYLRISCPFTLPYFSWVYHHEQCQPRHKRAHTQDISSLHTDISGWGKRCARTQHPLSTGLSLQVDVLIIDR